VAAVLGLPPLSDGELTVQEDERDLWRQADQALDRLLELPEGERPSALAAMALAPEVASRVLRLLEAAEQQGGPVDRPVGNHLPLEETTEEDPMAGRLLGAYRLVERVGRGGMSVVFRAERHDGGFEQQVALKILHLPQLGTFGATRFRQEQKILARLRHPGIATLFDGGLAEDGTPYLVMELIDGERIDQHCERRELAVAERVELVRQVCRAVGYAHSRLVVHRDIKPGNVLVREDGHVKLLDFGIAKLLEEGAEEVTRTHERALTPAYAAPEQLRGEAVTTATDVYSLGLLLYQLLVGEPAFADTGSLRDPEMSPLPPSQALRRRTTSSVADRRRLRELDGDLDRIVMMALRTEPERRYANAEDMARDLERWRRNLPVAATPDTLSYRLRRFADRRRGTVVAAALVLAVGAAGLAATLWKARDARRQAEHALAESKRAQAVRDFLVELFEANDPDVAQGRMPTARDLLDQGAHQLGSAFEGNPAMRAEMLVLLGHLYLQVGELEAARPLLEAGLDLARASGEPELLFVALHRAGQLDMHAGNLDQTLAALEMAEELLYETNQVPGERHGRLMQQVVRTLDEMGRRSEALARAESALALARSRPETPPAALFDYLWVAGNAYLQSEELDRAEAVIREAAELEFEAAFDPSYVMSVHTNLAAILDRRGNLEEALQHRRRALELAEEIYPPDHFRVAQALNNLGSALSSMGRLDDAATSLSRAVHIHERNSPDGRYPARAGAAFNNLALTLMRAERYEEAEQYQVRARQIAAELFGVDDLRYATATHNLGDLMTQLGRFEEAEALLLEALELRRQVLGPDHRLIGPGLGVLARLRLAEGRPSEALVLVDEALSIYRALGHEAPRELTGQLGHRARALAALGRYAEAEDSFGEAIALGEAAGGDVGDSWPRVLAAYAEHLAERAAPDAAAAAMRALEAHRSFFGDTHPATQRMEALVQVQSSARRQLGS
jgi:eukaryotic-like serine/threonine-protein kinase